VNPVEDEAKRHDRRSLDRIAAGAANILDVPRVVISVIDREQQECVGAYGIAAYPPGALCRAAARSGSPIVMQDVTRRSGRARSGWGVDMIAYAGMPLPMLDGARIGTLAAFAPTRKAWQSRDVLALRNFADAAAAILDLQWRRDAVIAQLREELEGAKRELAGKVLETAKRERVVSGGTDLDHRDTTDELREPLL
jgi:GAF domain-containing protein